ncbi:MAG: hypothetical protein LH615_00220 [Ferruginibacter sp.]|nr:hypothetical protein [Ferruginibacter sp.]
MFLIINGFSNIENDIWVDYDIGQGNPVDKDYKKRLHHFVAMRSFFNKFDSVHYTKYKY